MSAAFAPPAQRSLPCALEVANWTASKLGQASIQVPAVSPGLTSLPPETRHRLRALSGNISAFMLTLPASERARRRNAPDCSSALTPPSRAGAAAAASETLGFSCPAPPIANDVAPGGIAGTLCLSTLL